jgi:hypothetical protein
MGGRGGSGAGTKAWAFSPTVDMFPSALEFSLHPTCLEPKIRLGFILS